MDNTIYKALKEILPLKGPLQAPEGRREILKHLGQEDTHWGYYNNGSLRFPNLVSQTIARLREEGLVSTKGWTWMWNQVSPPQDVSPPQVLPPQAMVVEETDDLFDDLEEEDVSFLYDLTDEMTLAAVAAATPCFGKYLERDPACKGCPLAHYCGEKNQSLKAQKAARSALNAENHAVLSRLGVNLKTIKANLPKTALMQEAAIINAKCDIDCVCSGVRLYAGETVVFVPQWGILHKIVYESLIS